MIALTDDMNVSFTGEDSPVRLDIGGGENPLPNHLVIDKSMGREAYPLDLPDDSVDEIHASHVLEHFSHSQTLDVLKDWVRVLKPNGAIRIAVPDFDAIVRIYADGKSQDQPIESYVMGGHVDENDRHGAIFNRNKLASLMSMAGLTCITEWTPAEGTCAALSVSLNLMGIKASVQRKIENVFGVMSIPRLGFTDNFFDIHDHLLKPFKIPITRQSGAYWGQCLERSMERVIGDGAQWILTIDYDTRFKSEHILTMLQALTCNASIDALAPIQCARGKPLPLFTKREEDGKNKPIIEWGEFYKPTMPIDTAHFGLTLIDATKLARLPKPWFLDVPDKDGCWGDGRIDADVQFWRKWTAAGNSLHLANRVPVGHIERVVMVPNNKLGIAYVTPGDYDEGRLPRSAWR